MAGLEKIIERISQDSAAKCDNIIFTAQAQAAKIKETAQNTAEADKLKVLESARNEAKMIDTAAISSADFAAKKDLLAAKIEIINLTLDKAVKKLGAMPDKEYFDALYALVKKYAAKDSDGVMKLSAADLKRLPNDFNKKINEGLNGKAKLTVDKNAADIKNGFILAYGDIEINCTFEALIEDSLDEIKDEIYKIIFA